MTSSTERIEAKLVVLGDQGTGKTLLIRSLIKENQARVEEVQGNDLNFIVFTQTELGNAAANAYIKPWEHSPSNSLTKKEEDLALNCALICIITVDLRSPASANSAFTKWTHLKETSMSEAFLIVVGTYLDCSSSRRVDVNSICAVCAERDALYIEVSSTESTNIKLLRSLIAKKVIFTLQIRESIRSFDYTALNEIDNKRSNKVVHQDEFESFEEKDTSEYNTTSNALSTRSILDRLKTPFLEPQILFSSVGSVYSSALGTNVWTGCLNNTTGYSSQKMTEIGKQISNYIDILTEEHHKHSAVNNRLPNKPLQSFIPPASHLFQLDDWNNFMPNTTQEGDAHEDVQELKHLFDTIGFTPSTKSLTQQQQNQQQMGLDNSYFAIKQTQKHSPMHVIDHNDSPPPAPRRGTKVAVAVKVPSPSTGPVNSTSNVTHGLSQHSPLDPPRKRSTSSASTHTVGSKSTTNSIAAVEKQIRMRIKLLDGSFSELHLNPTSDLDLQVDAFMRAHGMERDISSRKKIIENGQRLMHEYAKWKALQPIPPVAGKRDQVVKVEERSDTDASSASRYAPTYLQGHPSPTSTMQRFIAVRRRKLRIRLPVSGTGDGQPSDTQQAIDIMVNEGDDLVQLAVDLGDRFNLSREFQGKVLEDISAACC